MMRYQLYGISLFIFCAGLPFSLSNGSIAMEIDTRDSDLVAARGAPYVELSLGPVRFPFEKIEEIEKREFSSLVYRVGSTRVDTSEIGTYCAERANHYTRLANGDATSPHVETAKKWSKAYKEKALLDIGILEKFYLAADTNVSSLGSLITAQQSPRSTERKTRLESQSEESEYDSGAYSNAIAKIKAQKLQADALFHYFYPLYSSGKMKCFDSISRKINRYTEGGVFYRPEPDLTVPDEKNGKHFYDFYNALVPWGIRRSSDNT